MTLDHWTDGNFSQRGLCIFFNRHSLTAVKKTIEHNAAEIRRLKQAIDDAFLHRSESSQAFGVWKRACATFHAHYDALAFPGGLSSALERLAAGDALTAETAIIYLEVHPYFFRSQYNATRLVAFSRNSKCGLTFSNVSTHWSQQREHQGTKDALNNSPKAFAQERERSAAPRSRKFSAPICGRKKICVPAAKSLFLRTVYFRSPNDTNVPIPRATVVIVHGCIHSLF